MIERSTFLELTRKEVVNVCDGARLGFVCDIELDLCGGCVLALILPGQCRLFGLLKSADELVIPYCKVKKFGEDVILVELP